LRQSISSPLHHTDVSHASALFSFPTSVRVYSTWGTPSFLVAAACTLGAVALQKLGICHSELLLSQIIERRTYRGCIFWGLPPIPSWRICTLAFS